MNEKKRATQKDRVNRGHRASRSHSGRRAILLFIAIGAVVALVWQPWSLFGIASSPSLGTLTIRSGDRTISHLNLDRLFPGGQINRDTLVKVVDRRIPDTLTEHRGSAAMYYRTDRSALKRSIRRIGEGRDVLAVPRRFLRSTINAPVVAQKLRNNCETTALQIVLATEGVKREQLALQKDLARSGPLDPRGAGANMVWGDPDLGFVGRPDGGGTAGGFGVYPRPIIELAERNKVRLKNFSGASMSDVYRRLIDGKAVIAWVGLSDGPYGQWKSPEGRLIKVNFGEHTVVLTGINDEGIITVVNPLRGTKEFWSTDKFEAMWRLLGRRAIST